MPNRLTLRKEKHGDIYVLVDDKGWKRGFFYFEGSAYAILGPVGVGRCIPEERMGLPSKRAAEAALRKAIREAWNA